MGFFLLDVTMPVGKGFLSQSAIKMLDARARCRKYAIVFTSSIAFFGR
jgi:hypothetical protein